MSKRRVMAGFSMIALAWAATGCGGPDPRCTMLSECCTALEASMYSPDNAVEAYCGTVGQDVVAENEGDACYQHWASKLMAEIGGPDPRFRATIVKNLPEECTN